MEGMFCIRTPCNYTHARAFYSVIFCCYNIHNKLFISKNEFVQWWRKIVGVCNGYIYVQIFLLFESILFSIFTLVMFGTQVSSIYSDETAIESLKSQRGMEQIHERSDGWKNLQQVISMNMKHINMYMYGRSSEVHSLLNGWIHWQQHIILVLVMSIVSNLFIYLYLYSTGLLLQYDDSDSLSIYIYIYKYIFIIMSTSQFCPSLIIPFIPRVSIHCSLCLSHFCICTACLFSLIIHSVFYCTLLCINLNCIVILYAFGSSLQVACRRVE